MGDRCYLEVIVAECDIKLFAKIVLDGDLLIANVDDNMLYVEEANYALWDELREAARHGCCFYGYHGDGANYGSSAFAAMDGKMADGITDHDGHPVVRCSKNGPVQEDIDEVMEYYRLKEAAKTRIEDPFFDACLGEVFDTNSK
jgi:hypothetical protein